MREFDPATARWRERPDVRAPRVSASSVSTPAPPDTKTQVWASRAARMYHAARPSRLTQGWQTSNSSADSELVSSLTTLRSRSRALVRDAGYAKRAQTVVVNNVVGSGIGMQAQVMNSRGKLHAAINEAIEAAWCEWSRAEYCHTGGTLAFADLERVCMGQVFEAGEVLIRKHYRAFGGSPIPFALEVIEPERIADNLYGVDAPVAAPNQIRLGVEIDEFGRPLAYWLRRRHPGELRYAQGETTDSLERVPASQIIHLRLVDRWPQTRGIPWMHATIRKLADIDGYTEAEIVAARGAASYMGIITTPEPDGGYEEQDDGSQQLELSPGVIERLAPGEKFDLVNPSRPNAQADPFIRLMLREVAAGIGVSYESLSRDYSQSNYSSSRLALIDDRDLWRMLQQWFIRSLRMTLHREWLQQAVLARAITAIPLERYVMNRAAFEAVRFKPRGWGWIDPTKEVDAYKEAIKAGLTTRTDVIAATGGGIDVEDVDRTRARELEMAEEAGLPYDVDVPVAPPAPTATAPPDAEDDPPDDPATDTEDDPPARVVSFGRRDA